MRATFLAGLCCSSQSDQRYRKPPPPPLLPPPPSSAAPFPLARHHICWDVYFCYALSRHVSFHSPVVSMTLALQVVIILPMARGQESRGPVAVLRQQKCGVKNNATYANTCPVLDAILSSGQLAVLRVSSRQLSRHFIVIRFRVTLWLFEQQLILCWLKLSY